MKKSKMTKSQAIKLTLKGIKRAIKKAIQKIRKELRNKQQNNKRDEVSKIWFDRLPLNLIKLNFGNFTPSSSMLFEDLLKTV